MMKIRFGSAPVEAFDAEAKKVTDTYYAPMADKDIPTTEDGEYLFATAPKPAAKKAQPTCANAAIHTCYGDLWTCSRCNKTVCCAEGTDNHPELCDDCWLASEVTS